MRLLGTSQIGGVVYLNYQILLIGMAVLVIIGLRLLIKHTRLGRLITAVVADREMAQSIGIDTNRIFILAFSLGVFLAALGGALAMPTSGVAPGLGADTMVLAFAVAAIGGLGQIEGAAVAVADRRIGACAGDLFLSVAGRCGSLCRNADCPVDPPLRPVRLGHGPEDMMRSDSRRRGGSRPRRCYRFWRPWLQFVLTLAIAKGFAALGVAVLLRAGLISIGHAMFFAASAYGVAFLARAGVSDFATLLVLSVLAAALTGAMVGRVPHPLSRDLLRDAEPRRLDGFLRPVR